MKKWNERFAMGPGEIVWPDCPRCMHYDRIKESCPAYPKGAPEPIRTGGETHRTVRPDQVGTDVFTPMPGMDDETYYNGKPRHQ